MALLAFAGCGLLRVLSAPGAVVVLAQDVAVVVVRGAGATAAAYALVVAGSARALVCLRAQFLEYGAFAPDFVEGLFAHVAGVFGHICACTHNAFAAHDAIGQARQAAARVTRLHADLLGNAHELRRARGLHLDACVAAGAQDVGEQLLVLLDVDAFIGDIFAAADGHQEED